MPLLIKYKKLLSVLAIVSTIASTALIVSSDTSTAQSYSNPPGEEEQGETSLLMKASLGSALGAGRAGGKRFFDAGAMKAFYDARENQAFWMSSSGPYTRADELYAKLEQSWTHGLNPNNYHVKQIGKLIENPGMFNKADLELLLTDAFLRYARDMSGMRINPDDMKLDAKDWLMPMSGEDALSGLAAADDFDDLLEALEPKTATYKKIREEFIRVSAAPAAEYEKHLPVHFGGLMKPGWSHKGVLGLRLRLGVPVPERNKYVYDDELAAAVMKFQRENELDGDGVIGTRTLQLLNRTTYDKKLQLIANMERLRWIPEEKPEKFIVVNIPSATLWALEHGRVKIEMPVIVGSPWRRTRSFQTDITGVRLNPDWTVPPTIKAFDIVPKVKEDPNYLIDKGIELVRGYGTEAETLDPSVIDWDSITPQQLAKIRFIQIPGEHNPLGKIRILMPNDYNMYLHDTNHPELFDKAERQVSSGCMRMKYPEKVADWVMKDTPGWSTRKMNEIIETGETTDLDIAKKIPVYVLYYTAWIGDQGRVVYGADVYNYDTKLVDLLASVDGLPIPRQNGGNSAGSAPRAAIASAQ
jgi:murein L,D-transpeptidase YcbB/YkuD